MYCILFICLSVDGHLGCLHLLAIVNNTDVNMSVHISLQVLTFSSLGYIARGGPAGFYGSSMLKSLRKCHAVSHSTCTVFVEWL